MKHFIPDINDELLVKYLLGEASVVEIELVRAWIAESPDHRRYFRQFEFVWQQSKLVAKNISVDEDAAWQRFRQRVSIEKKAVLPMKRLNRFPVWKIAATILVIISVMGLLYFALFQQKQSVLLSTLENVIKDTLPDQSVVTLNKNSSLNYSEQGGANPARRVKLKGEAFFAVAAEKSRPFLIEVDALVIRVVGTSFNVRDEENYTEIIVESGIVTVSKLNQTVTLTKGEKIQVAHAGPLTEKSAVTDQLYNYYRSREFVCDNTPLWKLVEVLNEAYDSRIIIQRSEIRDLRINTTFNNEPLENVLNIIAETLDIKIEKQKTAIYLR